MPIRSVRFAALIDPVPGKQRRIAVSLGLLLACLAFFIAGCGDDDPAEQSAGITPGSVGSGTPAAEGAPEVGTGEVVSNVRLIEDGLTAAERQEFFHLTMGSELFPLRWMQNLVNSATGKPFLEDVERFGLVPDPKNPDGLPVGLTAADSIDIRGVGKMVGLNCSACHTSIVTYHAASVVVVGGSSLFDAEKFTAELFASAGATAKDPEQLIAFVHRLWDSGRGKELPAHDATAQILAHLAENADSRKSLADKLKSLLANASAAPEGELMQSFRRLAGQAKKEIRGGLLHGFEQKVRSTISTALSDFKVDLKGVSEDLRSQAIVHLSEEFFIVARLLGGRIAFARELVELAKLNLPTTSAGPGRADDFGAGRNVLFGAATAEPMTGPCSIPPLFDLQGVEWTDWDGNTTSAMGRSMLTALVGGAGFNPETLTSTVPTKNLARLEELAGKLKPPAWPTKLFGELDAQKITAGESLFKEHCAKCHRPAIVDAQDAPAASIYPLSEIGTDPNRLENYLKPLGSRNFAKALQETSQAYIDVANQDAGITAAEAARMSAGHPNVWRDTNGYVARSLAGIWSTAPYLHNGSVPTIWHLLKSSDQRPKKFSVGDSNYDPEKVGFVSEVSESSRFVFDTSQSGNSNGGHDYGTSLTDAARMSLIEYRKSL